MPLPMRLNKRSCRQCATKFLPVCGTDWYCGLPCRFWVRVDRRAPDECWPWTGSRTEGGYGRSMVGGGRWRAAHRVAWTLQRGPIPARMEVCHRCDNPPCVNVDHLFVGTRKENSDDMDRKGRRVVNNTKGSKRWNSLLTEDIVRDARRRAALGESRMALAVEYGVSVLTLYSVIAGRSWRHVK